MSVALFHSWELFGYYQVILADILGVTLGHFGWTSRIENARDPPEAVNSKYSDILRYVIQTKIHVSHMMMRILRKLTSFCDLSTPIKR